jgi:uncharacterized membrane-anchored protein YhcB (DUF1043 family)
MDDNTTKVLMALIALISGVVTPIVVVYVGKQNAKKIVAVTDKVDEYHKEINGRMGQLLDTTKELATAQEKVRASTEDKQSTGTGVKKNLDQAKEKIDEAKKKL